ncbi:GntR family transcriptional regulator [Actinomycetospora atypica]|uniref:GntR family transcriptional regulator n=1 Tax=Actinomycetospora atypica TaxID=1290095 RepID=A0ABV9YL43_9PSEU
MCRRDGRAIERPAQELAYEVLHRGIATGEYPPGTWVREDEVVARAGVSRTPVREALQRLQTEGMVELVRHRGALVVGWTAQDLDDLYDLRVVLEAYGARRAAGCCAGEDLEHLRGLCDRMDGLLPASDRDGREQLALLCIDFHTGLHRASGNRQLVALIPSIVARPRRAPRRAGRHRRCRGRTAAPRSHPRR